MDIGRKIRIARKSCKVTQAELSERSGLSIDTIRNLEYGRSTGTIRSLIAISTALGKRLVVFFDEY